MTLFFYYGAGDLGDRAVRLGKGFALTEYAEAGTVATSNVDVDDPTGALALVGLKSFKVDETACAWQRLFQGYVADRTIGRADSLLTGAARRWSASVIDANGALNLRVLRGSAANRPAETDIARITWYLSTAFTSGITDGGFIDSGSPVDLEAADYRGRTGSDLVADAAAISGKNFFTQWDQATSSLVLHYYASDSTLNSCTVKISGTLADIDSTTVFGAAVPGGLLRRDPSRVYSGVYMNYGTGAAAVYVENPTTASTFIPRDAAVSDTTVKGSTQATAKANQFLEMAEDEFDQITCKLSNVPAATAGLIRAGQRIEVKFQHLPDYTSYTWIRINKRVIRQAGETDQLYELDLELSNTKIGPTSPWNQGTPPGPVCYDVFAPEDEQPECNDVSNPQDFSVDVGPLAQQIIIWQAYITASGDIEITWTEDGEIYKGVDSEYPWHKAWATARIYQDASWTDPDVPPTADDLDAFVIAGSGPFLAPIIQIGGSYSSPEGPQIGWRPFDDTGGDPAAAGSPAVYALTTGLWAVIYVNSYRQCINVGHADYAQSPWLAAAGIDWDFTITLPGTYTCFTPVPVLLGQVCQGAIYGPVVLFPDVDGVYTFPYPFVAGTLQVLVGGTSQVPQNIDMDNYTFELIADPGIMIVEAYAQIPLSYAP